MPQAHRTTAADESLERLAPALAYCRRARRLRATLARQPGRMHRQLRALAAKQGAIAPVVPIEAAPASPARAFAERVAGELDGPVVRYARRRSLLAEASRAGIGAFEANLIIAAVQHERRTTTISAQRPTTPARARRFTSLGPFFVVALVEAIVAIGAWQVFVA